MRRSGIVLAIVLLGGSLAGVSHACADEPISFRGKTITMIVATAPGGGTDAAGRLMGSFIASRLPGKPSVVVRNIPGAQGMTAMNYFANQVAPDGLTITVGSTLQADPLFYHKAQSQFDPATFAFIGGIGRGGTVLIINKDAEPRLYDKHRPPVIMGSLTGSPRTGMQTTGWGIEFLNWNARWVVGYRGTNDLLLALDRGEIEMTGTANVFQIQKFLASGRFKLLSQSGVAQGGQMVPRPEFGDTPIFTHLMQDKIKEPVVQRAFDYWVSMTAFDKWVALPPKTPEPVIRLYRDAYAQAFNDSEFRDLGRKISEDFEPMGFESVKFLIGRLGSTPPEATSYIGTMLRKQGLEAD